MNVSKEIQWYSDVYTFISMDVEANGEQWIKLSIIHFGIVKPYINTNTTSL